MLPEKEEFLNAFGLIMDLYNKTRDIMLITNSEVRRIENSIQETMEKMVTLIRGNGSYEMDRINVYNCEKTGLPKDELERAIDALNELFYMAHDLSIEAYDLRFMQGTVVCHLKNIKMLHDEIHEARYYEDVIKPSTFRKGGAKS